MIEDTVGAFRWLARVEIVFEPDSALKRSEDCGVSVRYVGSKEEEEEAAAAAVVAAEAAAATAAATAAEEAEAPSGVRQSAGGKENGGERLTGGRPSAAAARSSSARSSSPALRFSGPVRDTTTALPEDVENGFAGEGEIDSRTEGHIDDHSSQKHHPAHHRPNEDPPPPPPPPPPPLTHRRGIEALGPHTLLSDAGHTGDAGHGSRRKRQPPRVGDGAQPRRRQQPQIAPRR